MAYKSAINVVHAKLESISEAQVLIDDKVELIKRRKQNFGGLEAFSKILLKFEREKKLQEEKLNGLLRQLSSTESENEYWKREINSFRLNILSQENEKRRLLRERDEKEAVLHELLTQISEINRVKNVQLKEIYELEANESKKNEEFRQKIKAHEIDITKFSDLKTFVDKSVKKRKEKEIEEKLRMASKAEERAKFQNSLEQLRQGSPQEQSLKNEITSLSTAFGILSSSLGSGNFEEIIQKVLKLENKNQLNFQKVEHQHQEVREKRQILTELEKKHEKILEDIQSTKVQDKKQVEIELLEEEIKQIRKNISAFSVVNQEKKSEIEQVNETLSQDFGILFGTVEEKLSQLEIQVQELLKKPEELQESTKLQTYVDEAWIPLPLVPPLIINAEKQREQQSIAQEHIMEEKGGNTLVGEHNNVPNSVDPESLDEMLELQLEETATTTVFEEVCTTTGTENEQEKARNETYENFLEIKQGHKIYSCTETQTISEESREKAVELVALEIVSKAIQTSKLNSPLQVEEPEPEVNELSLEKEIDMMLKAVVNTPGCMFPAKYYPGYLGVDIRPEIMEFVRLYGGSTENIDNNASPKKRDVNVDRQRPKQSEQESLSSKKSYMKSSRRKGQQTRKKKNDQATEFLMKAYSMYDEVLGERDHI
eukprot:augustus_masked-scaffold_6-processed-gene-10.46-mRNA-1 protein AED:1.00 eAED:1.00 QI:0/0/0/0/1/1/2/0/655